MGIGVIGIAVSGIRNVINGKSEFKRVTVMLVPVLVFVGSYLTMGTFDQAGMATLGIHDGHNDTWNYDYRYPWNFQILN
jgi:hypothetical protein